MSVKFVKGTMNIFFDTLNMGYGFLYIDDGKPLLIIFLEWGKYAIQKITDGGLISEKERQNLELEMIRANMVDRPDDVADIFKKFELPITFVPAYGFEMRDGDSRLSPHGVVKYLDTQLDIIRVFSLDEGLRICYQLVMSNQIHILDGIYLFKQMLETNLPLGKASDGAVQKPQNYFGPN